MSLHGAHFNKTLLNLYKMGRALVNMNGGKTTIKKKMQAGGVAGKQPKAGKVDPNGAYTKVQERTLGDMKKGGKIKKAQDGDKLKTREDIKKSYESSTSPKIMQSPNFRNTKSEIDTVGYSAGRKMFPVKTTKTNKSGASSESTFERVGRNVVDKSIKKAKAKTGAKVDKNWIQKAVNPKHKGFCTPLSKKTCTPKRKALAMTFKKMAKARKK